MASRELFERGSLISHLRADARFLRDLRQQPRLVDGPRQRLLGVAADAEPHGRERGGSVHVVRRADRRDLDVLAVLGQQFAEVGELLGTLELVRIPLAFERIAIDVADGNDIAEFRGIVRIAAPFASHANAGDVELLIGGLAQRLPGTGGHKEAGACDGGRLQERAACCLGHSLYLSVAANETNAISTYCDRKGSINNAPPATCRRASSRG